MDPPLAFEPARGRSKRFENALDERDPWRLPGEERAIVSRGVADESAGVSTGVDTPLTRACQHVGAKVPARDRGVVAQQSR